MFLLKEILIMGFGVFCFWDKCLKMRLIIIFGGVFVGGYLGFWGVFVLLEGGKLGLNTPILVELDV